MADWVIGLPFKNDPILASKGFYPVGRGYPDGASDECRSRSIATIKAIGQSLGMGSVFDPVTYEQAQPLLCFLID